MSNHPKNLTIKGILFKQTNNSNLPQEPPLPLRRQGKRQFYSCFTLLTHGYKPHDVQLELIQQKRTVYEFYQIILYRFQLTGQNILTGREIPTRYLKLVTKRPNLPNIHIFRHMNASKEYSSRMIRKLQQKTFIIPF